MRMALKCRNTHDREQSRAVDFICNVNLYPKCINMLETEELNLKWDNARGAEVSVTERDRQRIRGLISLK